MVFTFFFTREKFMTYKIKNGTERYNHLITNLPSDVTSKLLHLLNHPMEVATDVDPRLDMLKSALFQRYSPTEYQLFLNYDMMKPLQPGMKPSVLCDNLRVALPAHVCVENYFSGTDSSRCCRHRLGHSVWPQSSWTPMNSQHSLTASTRPTPALSRPSRRSLTTWSVLPPRSGGRLHQCRLCCRISREQALRCTGGGCPQTLHRTELRRGNANRLGRCA